MDENSRIVDRHDANISPPSSSSIVYHKVSIHPHTPSPFRHQRKLMALPLIKSVADCADYSKTVLPYIGQLYDLPQQVFDNITNLQALKVLYVSTNPLITAFAFSLFLFPVFLVVSEINKNYSQVDRCWSILPTIYNAHYTAYAHATGLSTRRMDVLLLSSIIWSVSVQLNSRHAFTDWSSPGCPLITGAKEATISARKIIDGKS